MGSSLATGKHPASWLKKPKGVGEELLGFVPWGGPGEWGAPMAIALCDKVRKLWVLRCMTEMKAVKNMKKQQCFSGIQIIGS